MNATITLELFQPWVVLIFIAVLVSSVSKILSSDCILYRLFVYKFKSTKRRQDFKCTDVDTLLLENWMLTKRSGVF